MNIRFFHTINELAGLTGKIRTKSNFFTVAIIKFHEVTGENGTEHNPKWLQIPEYSILVVQEKESKCMIKSSLHKKNIRGRIWHKYLKIHLSILG